MILSEVIIVLRDSGGLVRLGIIGIVMGFGVHGIIITGVSNLLGATFEHFVMAVGAMDVFNRVLEADRN